MIQLQPVWRAAPAAAASILFASLASLASLPLAANSDAGTTSKSADAVADAGLAAAATDSALPPLPEFDRIVYAKLHAGIIVSEASDNEGHGGKVHAWEVCRCRIDALWAVLTNHGAFPEFVPRVTSMVITNRSDRGERAEQTVDATIANVRYSLDYNWDPSTRRIDFHLVEEAPHDLKAVAGVWQLWPIDHGAATLLDYQSAVDTGRQIPGFIRDYLADRGVKDTLGAVRTRAEAMKAH